MAYDFVPAQYLTGSNPVSGPPFSISCIFRADIIVGSKRGLVQISKFVQGGNQWNFWALRVHDNSYLRFEIFNGPAGYAAVDIGPVSSNTLYQALAVEESSSIHRLYLDGGNKTTVNQGMTPEAPNCINIGGERMTGTAENLFDGVIAEVGVWNVALNDSEAASLGKRMSPRLIRPQNLVFYAPLVRNAQDISRSVSLTNSGGASPANHLRVYGQ
jgi:hypothetical protein